MSVRSISSGLVSGRGPPGPQARKSRSIVDGFFFVTDVSLRI